MASGQLARAPGLANGRWPLNAGRVLTGLAALFLLADSLLKLAMPEAMAANSPPGLDWPLAPADLRTVGLLLLVPTLLYLWPRTAVLGAVLITGYLGGTVAIHLRAGSPLLSHTLFGVYLGLMVWGGLWLRHPALRALFPLQPQKD